MYEEPKMPYEYAVALEDYKSHLAETFAVANTRRMYSSQVKQLLIYMCEKGFSLTALQATPEQIIDSYIRNRQLRPNTINHFLSATRHFLKYLRIDRDLLTYRKERQVRKAESLSQPELERLMKVVQNWPAKKARSILLLLVHAGLRISDLTLLNRNDVIHSEGTTYIFLRTTTMSGIIEIPTIAAQALEAWILERETKFPHCTDTALFVNAAGIRISASGIDRLIRRIGHAAYLNISARKLKDTWKLQADVRLGAASRNLQTIA